jgi:hypothetical protein
MAIVFDLGATHPLLAAIQRAFIFFQVSIANQCGELFGGNFQQLPRVLQSYEIDRCIHGLKIQRRINPRQRENIGKIEGRCMVGAMTIIQRKRAK